MIGVVIFLLANRKSFDIPYVLVLSLESEAAEKSAFVYVNQYTKKNVVKTKTVSKGHIEVTSEVCLKDALTEFINGLVDMNGVINASLVSFNVEYVVCRNYP